MALQYVDRPAVHSTKYAHKPTLGFVLHDTESAYDITTQQSAGGWQWEVGRNGVLYKDCDENQAAWGVEATGSTAASKLVTRWRPDWMVDAPDKGVSAANYSCIHVEIVSCQAFRDVGVPYTDVQYVTLRTLLADLVARYGALPIVRHGDLQTNRTDPVQLDMARLGLTTTDGRTYTYAAFTPAPPAPPPQPVDNPSGPTYNELVAALLLANWQKHEMEAYIRDAEHRASVDADAAGKGIAPIDDMLQWASDHAAAGETAP